MYKKIFKIFTFLVIVLSLSFWASCLWSMEERSIPAARKNAEKPEEGGSSSSKKTATEKQPFNFKIGDKEYRGVSFDIVEKIKTLKDMIGDCKEQVESIPIDELFPSQEAYETNQKDFEKVIAFLESPQIVQECLSCNSLEEMEEIIRFLNNINMLNVEIILQIGIKALARSIDDTIQQNGEQVIPVLKNLDRYLFSQVCMHLKFVKPILVDKFLVDGTSLPYTITNLPYTIMVFNKDGDKIAIYGVLRKVYIIDTKKRVIQHLTDLDSKPWMLKFSNSQSDILFIGHDKYISIFDIKENKELKRIDMPLPELLYWGSRSTTPLDFKSIIELANMHKLKELLIHEYGVLRLDEEIMAINVFCIGHTLASEVIVRKEMNQIMSFTAFTKGDPICGFREIRIHPTKPLVYFIGNYVRFTESTLFSGDINTGEVKSIVDQGHPIRKFEFNSDGSTLFFLANGLWKIDTETNKESELFYAADCFAVSPKEDENLFFAVQRKSEISLYTIPQGIMRKIATPEQLHLLYKIEKRRSSEKKLKLCEHCNSDLYHLYKLIKSTDNVEALSCLVKVDDSGHCKYCTESHSAPVVTQREPSISAHIPAGHAPLIGAPHIPVGTHYTWRSYWNTLKEKITRRPVLSVGIAGATALGGYLLYKNLLYKKLGRTCIKKYLF